MMLGLHARRMRRMRFTFARRPRTRAMPSWRSRRDIVLVDVRLSEIHRDASRGDALPNSAEDSPDRGRPVRRRGAAWEG